MMLRQASQRWTTSAANVIRGQSLPRTISGADRPKIGCSNVSGDRSNQFSHVHLLQPIQIRTLSQTQRIRHGFREASRGIWRKNPIVFPLTIICVLGSVAFFAYVAYMEVNVVGPQYAKFPPPVADALRAAIYYTEIDLNPPKALSAYKEALRLATEANMHPFSDEVLGIRIQVAFMLEKSGLIRQAIEVLERLKSDCLKFVSRTREAKHTNPAAGSEHLKSSSGPVPVDLPEWNEAAEKAKEIALYNDRQRTMALKKVVGVNLKLAELYSNDSVQDLKMAEECQVNGVELCLKEMGRRQKLGIPVGGASNENDVWLSLTEISAALLELAQTYHDQKKMELALPLYLRALDLVRADEAGAPSCKQVVLLNNIAGAMVELAENPRQEVEHALSRDKSLSAARKWALKTIEVAQKVDPSVKDESCDESCVASTFSLARMEELEGSLDNAVKHYTQARSMADAIGFNEGVLAADEELQRLQRPAA